MNGKLLKKIRLSIERFTVDNGQLQEQIDSAPMLNRKGIARFYRRDLHVLLVAATEELGIGERLKLKALQAATMEPTFAD